MKKEDFLDKELNLHLFGKQHPLIKSPRTIGQKAADNLTRWAGSWTFIIGFAIFIILWMIVNTTWMIFGSIWDPRPFIMLNLVLSCLAAIQAPIILMSQNRENQRDRIRARYDYNINKKAEKEIQQVKKQVTEIKALLLKHRR